jgi:hypothetical protein
VRKYGNSRFINATKSGGSLNEARYESDYIRETCKQYMDAHTGEQKRYLKLILESSKRSRQCSVAHTLRYDSSSRIYKATRKITPGELLTKQAMRKNYVYKQKIRTYLTCFSTKSPPELRPFIVGE